MDKSATDWMIEPLRRYMQFSGRARRAEYWWFILLGMIVGLIASFIDLALGFRVVGIGSFVSLALLIPQLAVGARRLHDTGRSGWWLSGSLVIFVVFGSIFGLAAASGDKPSGIVTAVFFVAVFVYGITLLAWTTQRGTVGDNRFGPDPLAAIDPL